MRFSVLDKVNPANRILDKAIKLADLVISKEEEYSKYSIEDLRLKTQSFVKDLEDNKIVLDDILIDALATGRAIIAKTTGMLAFKVQIIGAIIIYFGDFAEMMTGEGKTLTIALASFVIALEKKGVHIVSVNEYLVQRDAEFSSQIMNPVGLTTGYITSSMNQDEKRQNYNCDITYCSNSELGFDYLRDNMVSKYSDKVQRKLHFAIVDEADSVLIDESRTPLIISGSPVSSIQDYVKVDQFVKTLTPSDYVIDYESSSISLSDFGAEKANKFFQINNIYDLESSSLLHKVINSLKANYLFFNGKEYIVRKNDQGEDEIALVDQFTGRIMSDRTYSSGLHQAIQAKEYVKIDPENLTVATITYQSFFRLYSHLAGVSGTAATEAEELLNIYNMVVVTIPTNKPIQRIDQPDYVFSDKKTKWKYVVAEVIKRHKTGQPILIGTGAVEDSEILHLLLSRVGIPHKVLNAKNHAQEAEIIKDAGQKGQVTVATYMAGRGTDIKLGEGVRELGGLYVIGTERSESRRIDNQLRGRSGRQGDPGESRFFISLHDTLFKRFAGDKFNKANTKMEDEVIDLKFFSKLLDNTQKKVEGLNFDMRKNLIDYDHVLSAQRELLYKERDIVLLSNNLMPILDSMIPYVVDDILSNHVDKINPDFVDNDEVIKEMNETIFHSNRLNAEKYSKFSSDVLRQKLIKQIKEFLLEKEKLLTPETFNNSARNTIISNMDAAWTAHLEMISKLREGVNLRAYEQKSPLNIYVEDADILFWELKVQIANKVIRNVANFGEMINLSNRNIAQLININPLDIKEIVVENPANQIQKIREFNKQFLKYTLNNNDKKFIFSLLTSDKSIKYFEDLNNPIQDYTIDDESKVLS
ncbi:MAG: preprotein translocase subunit SecA [Candidatus Ureaplasma intestinipullorum]|uniref:Protein translocase subunit SecA n=1 Tax=Candidatus Ureaplasma intestinipullorum TaxID=2838770 RepID=A0A9E2KXF6_9BACT|nr:preprotein translocase subunit SecA [Candidatus Ureaplasma intestinipullorum]